MGWLACRHLSRAARERLSVPAAYTAIAVMTPTVSQVFTSGILPGRRRPAAAGPRSDRARTRSRCNPRSPVRSANSSSVYEQARLIPGPGEPYRNPIIPAYTSARRALLPAVRSGVRPSRAVKYAISSTTPAVRPTAVGPPPARPPPQTTGLPDTGATRTYRLHQHPQRPLRKPSRYRHPPATQRATCQHPPAPQGLVHASSISRTLGVQDP